METQYLFRLDDISWDMNFERFDRICDLFFRYDVKPIIGIIPDNRDTHLQSFIGMKSVSKEAFWCKMRQLQQEHGWSVALHGLNHLYRTQDSGILKINSRSEFAGVSLSEQEKMIREGKRILESNGLIVDSFMAPAHSFDWNTVEALKSNGIFSITDGNRFFPYKQRGMQFIPQLTESPRRFPFGVITFCLHINIATDSFFVSLEEFCKKNRENIVSYQETKDYHVGFAKRIVNFFISKPVFFALQLKRKQQAKKERA